MTPLTVLQPEWRRLELLGLCLNETRRGHPVGESLQAQLQAAQAEVEHGRAHSPWRELAGAGLGSLDQDILVCTTAPEAMPRLGWTFQELQPGLGSPYPTPALIRELLFLEEAETPAFHARFQHDAPLRRAGLIEPGGEDLYQPLRPTPRTRFLLLGWPPPPLAVPPGTLELPVRAAWEELVLPDVCLQGLWEFMLWITQRCTLEEIWGVRPGGGPIALFAGPSGTGKSFAAEVLAGALGFRLLRVDLGLLVSKYVGETEKNLNAVFDAVAGESVVLLFDEADSLFGRRGEIKDARDRYANMEVSHLLSRIEHHVGPCILTTNLRQSLDPAFTRRFHVVVEFPRPDTAERARLWHQSLPPRAPLDPAVDTVLLAEAVPLTGAQIHNAALRAALFAAAANQSINLRHLARAVWTELGKDGRERSPESIGNLAAHLEENR
ncbi:MAG: ATP-binding protein [Candidatus Competibacteraceae bacterium]